MRDKNYVNNWHPQCQELVVHPFQSSRQPVYVQIPYTFGLNPHLLICPLKDQLVYILRNTHIALGLTTFRRGKLNTPLK